MAEFLVNIDVGDPERGVDFYTRVFGLTIGRRFGGDGVELLGGPAPIYLLRKAAGSTAVPDAPMLRDYARHWTPVHLDFVCDDVDAIVARALAAGATLERPATSICGAASRCSRTRLATNSASSSS